MSWSYHTKSSPSSIRKQARGLLTFLPSCSLASDRAEKAIQVCLWFIVQLTKFIVSDVCFRKFPTDGPYSIAFILNNGWITGFSDVLINCDPTGSCLLPEERVCPPSAFLVSTVESCLSRPLPWVRGGEGQRDLEQVPQLKVLRLAVLFQIFQTFLLCLCGSYLLDFMKSYSSRFYILLDLTFFPPCIKAFFFFFFTNR